LEAFSELERGNIHNAFATIQGWYKKRGGPITKPTSADMEQLRDTYQSFFATSPPPGDPIPIHVDPYPVNDDVPSEEEISFALDHMCRGRCPGPSGI
jgi:hypothetical protein